MAELRSVDPRTLTPNPDNPRKTPAPQAMDDQLLASITAIGIIQPPVVRDVDGQLVIKAGERRVKAAIRAEMPMIDVLVRDSDDAQVPMESLSENLVRAAMNNVDIWRAIERLEKESWNEQAIADALALPVRTVKRLKLLARLHPPMLDVMAKGSMPSEDQLRTIAAASLEEQAQVWKKNKPKKGDDFSWYHVAHALSKRRIPFAAAKFDDELARAYGVEWHDDLFAPAGEDGRYTTNVDGFFGAQQEWLANHLPEKGTLLTQNEYGQPELPKKAERIYGKPSKGDITGHYLDPNSGEVKTVAYRMPVAKKPGKAGKEAGPTDTPDDASGEPTARSRPDVTSRGNAMIGDLRTDALHRALQDNAFSDQTLIGLLVLAIAGKNVSVQGPNETGAWDRHALGAKIAQGGVLTSDDGLLRQTAREMLVSVLSCRDNMSNSGVVACVAGAAIDAAAYLPNMATEEFLACLSRAALERSAATEGVRLEVRVKDTRARMVERFKEGCQSAPNSFQGTACKSFQLVGMVSVLFMVFGWVWSVASVSAWRFNGGEFVEVDIGNCLQSVGGRGGLEAIGDRLGPGGVFSLERNQLGNGVMPSLWPGAPVSRSLVANHRGGCLSLDAGTIPCLPFGTAERVVALWRSASWHDLFSVT